LALLADALHSGDGDIHESQNGLREDPVVCWRCPFPSTPIYSPNFCHHSIEMWNAIRDNGAFLGRQLLAVLLLTMLNLIDAITYGRLIIPNPAYSSLGMTMFLLGTFTLQLTLSLSSSFRSGVTGASIIENIPFIHTMYYSLLSQGIDLEAAISTLLYACILATLLDSLLFLLLAWSGMDRLIHQFPRSVLVGTMGGIGLFLIRTAIRIASDNYKDSLLSTLSIILIPSVFALCALFGEKRMQYQFVAPMGSILLLVMFHLALILLRVPMESARDHGWLLPKDTITDTTDAFTSILNLFTRLNPKNINVKGLYSLLTTLLSMSLFGLLHLPINIPSFARSTNNSFCMHQELLAHCYANVASSLLGFLPGYFVYSNSVLFFKIGARGRMTSVVLSLATLCLLFSINIASFIPIIMVTD
jgi:sulfate permease, SulP family